MNKELKKALFELMDSHRKLSKAELNRNPSYNNQHFSHKAEESIITYLSENEPHILNEYLDAR